jgi:hypothetical protein
MRNGVMDTRIDAPVLRGSLVRLRDGRAVGCTCYCTPRFYAERPGCYATEIGWTWLAASAQRTGINAEAKLLLMTYAFETLGVARVDLRTDARNERSRQAIAGLGAQFEGILRSSSLSRAPGEEGLLRDSAMFSVIAAEWPAVRAKLTAPGQPLNFLMASSVTGVKKLRRLPSGSRNRIERLPHGMVVGSCTHWLTSGLSRSYSLSTSSTRNSMMTLRLSAGRAESSPNSCVVCVWPIARVHDRMTSSAKTGV